MNAELLMSRLIDVPKAPLMHGQLPFFCLVIAVIFVILRRVRQGPIKLIKKENLFINAQIYTPSRFIQYAILAIGFVIALSIAGIVD